jgi:REP element-mobilizing transposase RayT
MGLVDDRHRIELKEAGWHTRGYLPHFDGEVIPQFITIHLADSIPQEVLYRWEQELSYMKEEPRKIWLQKRLNKYLDQGYGECLLKIPRIATEVKDCLLNLASERCKLFSWVVMPNHAHALLMRSEDDELSDLIHSLKSFTAHKANEILGRSGKFWFEEYFDRYIRNEKHFYDTVRYIENNPVKARLCDTPSDWPFSSARLRQ